MGLRLGGDVAIVKLLESDWLNSWDDQVIPAGSGNFSEVERGRYLRLTEALGPFPPLDFGVTVKV